MKPKYQLLGPKYIEQFTPDHYIEVYLTSALCSCGMHMWKYKRFKGGKSRMSNYFHCSYCMNHHLEVSKIEYRLLGDYYRQTDDTRKSLFCEHKPEMN